MDPCPFARLIVESLELKLPNHSTKPGGRTGIHPSATPCFCKLRLPGFPFQTALLSLATQSPPHSATSAATFYLDAAALRRLSAAAPTVLRVSVYAGRMGTTCGAATGKLLGRARVALEGALAGPATLHSGWVELSGGGDVAARVHVVVRSEPEPRFVFQFGGEPECSPVVYQIQESIRQPVFSCKFSNDRNSRCRSSLASDFTGNHKWWFRTLSGDREKPGRERKGWMVTIHDLSGSPVAAASMATPFVPSPGTDRVSRSNPGAWLILRPNGPNNGWKPWGRLEAWRERGSVDGLGYRFKRATEGGPVAEGSVSMRRGGRFCIEGGAARGFVVGSTVAAEGKPSRPTLQVDARHITCMADAALFVALSAAVDLSMDACRLFSHKLRKELCQHLT